MKMRSLRRLMGLAIVASCASSASAAVLFSDDFNTAGSSAYWQTNVAPAANAAQQGALYGFDYSTLGIPAAPGASDTLGLRLRANVPGSDAAPLTTRPGGVTSGLSVSPLSQNFGATFQATFYVWSNFNGTAANNTGLADNGTSEGGTNNVMFAIGTSGTVPLVVGNTGLASGGAMDAVGFAETGDGGITSDVRVYPASGTFAPATTGYYQGGTTAGTANANTAPYYQSIFGTHSAPAVQQTISTAEYGADANNTQQGSTQAGAFGFAWHQVVLTKDGSGTGTITWDVDGWRIATVPNANSLVLGGNNIGLGQSDVNTSTTRHPQLLFSVYDNLTVTDQIPEPTSALSLLGIGAVAMIRRRRQAR